MTGIEVQFEAQVASDSPSGQRAFGVLQEDASGERESDFTEGLQVTGQRGKLLATACFNEIQNPFICFINITSFTVVLLKQPNNYGTSVRQCFTFQWVVHVKIMAWRWRNSLEEVNDVHSFAFQRRSSRRFWPSLLFRRRLAASTRPAAVTARPASSRWSCGACIPRSCSFGSS